jgi:multidrug resistance efflux pump
MKEIDDPISNTELPGISSSRLFRQRFVPILIWMLVIAAFFALDSRQSGYTNAIGIVAIDEVVLSPSQDGTIVGLRVDLFDYVTEGEVLAILDDSLLVAELATKEAQLDQIHAELKLKRRNLELDLERNAVTQLDDLRRYQINEEQARLEVLDLSVEIEAEHVKLERLKIQLERQELLLSESVGNRSAVDDLRLRHKESTQVLKTKNAALIVAQRNADESERRRSERESQSEGTIPNPIVYMEPMLKELKVQEARREEIQQERLTFVLRAPVTGQVAKIFHGVGETILSGKPLLVIQNNHAKRVMAYVDEDAARTIRSGTEVVLRSKSRPNVFVTAQVLRAGSGLEELPRRIWSTPLIAEWGFPVLISRFTKNVFLPNETVHVRFNTRSD